MKTGNLNLDLQANPRNGYVINGLDGKIGDIFELKKTPNFELRWICIKKGEVKKSHAEPNTTAIVILIKGCHRVFFKSKMIDLNEQGDYVLIAPNEIHSWEAMEDNLLIALRLKS